MSEAREKGKADPERVLDVRSGDFVRITAEALGDKELADVTPIQLFKRGWPNKFMVVDIADDVDEGQVLRLDPCCGWMRNPENRDEHACQAHPAAYFELHPGDEEGAEKPSDDRYMGVKFAGLDLVSVEYLKGDGKGASLVIKLAGQKPVVLEGEAANQFAKILKSKKIL